MTHPPDDDTDEPLTRPKSEGIHNRLAVYLMKHGVLKFEDAELMAARIVEMTSGGRMFYLTEFPTGYQDCRWWDENSLNRAKARIAHVAEKYGIHGKIIKTIEIIENAS